VALTADPSSQSRCLGIIIPKPRATQKTNGDNTGDSNNHGDASRIHPINSVQRPAAPELTLIKRDASRCFRWLDGFSIKDAFDQDQHAWIARAY
jgi:hypothetical protein